MPRPNEAPECPSATSITSDPGEPGTGAGEIDLVMISNFGASDGGRETWAYQFIPRLLNERPDLRLNIYGQRPEGEADNSHRVDEAAGPARDRLTQTYLRADASRIPNSLLFSGGLRRVLRERGRASLVILAVGSVMELLAVLMSPQTRKSRKILWLRTVWTHEKAARIPAFLTWAAAAFERRILRRADVLIANGEDTADFYRRWGLRVEVIPNAVDLDRWKMDPPGFAGTVAIGFIGRIIEEKSYRNFVDAARALRGDQRFAFSIVGGPLNPVVDEAARDGLVSYRPAVSNHDVKTVLSGMDVCVALGKSGGGGGVSNALLEQMAAGRVIVAWDNPIYRQILDEECAYLVPQGSTAGLVDAFKDIADHPEKAAACGVSAMDRAKRYGWATHLDRFLSLLKSSEGRVA
jgi:glycosyltransferase involved in cell wall biosynthesis